MDREDVRRAMSNSRTRMQTRAMRNERRLPYAEMMEEMEKLRNENTMLLRMIQRQDIVLRRNGLYQIRRESDDEHSQSEGEHERYLIQQRVKARMDEKERELQWVQKRMRESEPYNYDEESDREHSQSEGEQRRWEMRKSMRLGT